MKHKDRASKIVHFHPRHNDHVHLEPTEQDVKEARAKLFRGDLSIEEYYQMVHLNRRGPCPNCGQYH